MSSENSIFKSIIKVNIYLSSVAHKEKSKNAKSVVEEEDDWLSD